MIITSVVHSFMKGEINICCSTSNFRFRVVGMNLCSVANREAGLRSLVKLERAVDGFGYKRNIKTSFHSIV